MYIGRRKYLCDIIRNWKYFRLSSTARHQPLSTIQVSSPHLRSRSVAFDIFQPVQIFSTDPFGRVQIHYLTSCKIPARYNNKGHVIYFMTTNNGKLQLDWCRIKTLNTTDFHTIPLPTWRWIGSKWDIIIIILLL